MASLSQSALAAPVRIFSGRNSLLDRYFYFAMSLLAAALVVSGFSHTIGFNLLHPAVPRPFILWVHAAVFSGWVAFFILQSALVRTRNVKIHRRLGLFGAWMGCLMVPLGVTTAIVMTRFEVHQLHQPGAATFIIVPFGDMLVFGVLFALAVAWRRKPELHRRLVLVATCALMAAAFGRFSYIQQHDLFYFGVDCLVLLGALRDLLVNRRIHRVYLIALPLMVVLERIQIYAIEAAPAWWMRIAHAIVG